MMASAEEQSPSGRSRVSSDMNSSIYLPKETTWR